MSDYSELRWRCRRGMSELDILLEAYLKQHYANASLDEQQAFKRLLKLPDPELFSCLLNNQAPEDKSLLNIINKIIHAEKTLQ